MEKNQANKWVVFAYGLPSHASPGEPVTGDAANITANIRIDGGAANAVDDTNPTELEDGYYVFDITATESNGDSLLLTPQSSTANVQVIAVPGAVWTRPPNFNALGIETDGDLTKCNLVATTTTNTDMRGTDSAALASVATEARLAELDAANIPTDLTTITAYVDELETRLSAVRAGYLDNLSAGAVSTAAALVTAQNDLDKITGADGATLATSQGAITWGGVTISVAGGVANITLAGSGSADGLAFTRSGSGGLFDTAWAAAIEAEVIKVLTTQMTEAYAADGVAPTLTQAIMLIQQLLSSFGYVGKTQTVRKIDDTTTAATFTLDDGTNPTSKTRTT